MTTELGFEVYPQDLCEVFAWDSAVEVVKKLGEGWRLPTKDELNKMWFKQKEVGGFGANYYWSSSEINSFKKGDGTAIYTWNQNFGSGLQYYSLKTNCFMVRPVRDTPLTRDPDVTIEERLKADPAFAAALYHEQRKQIAELEEQNLNMMALFRDFYDLGFNLDECWEIIKKYGGDA